VTDCLFVQQVLLAKMLRLLVSCRTTAKTDGVLRCLPFIGRCQRLLTSASVEDSPGVNFVNQDTEKLLSHSADDFNACDVNSGTFQTQLFEMLSNGHHSVPLSRLVREIKNSGLRRDDPRLADSMHVHVVFVIYTVVFSENYL